MRREPLAAIHGPQIAGVDEDDPSRFVCRRQEDYEFALPSPLQLIS